MDSNKPRRVSVKGRLWVNIIGLCLSAAFACIALTFGVRGVMRHRDLLGLTSIAISALIAAAFGLAFAVGIRRRGNPDARFLLAGFLLVVLQSVLDAIRF
jgi:hypothetical protein